MCRPLRRSGLGFLIIYFLRGLGAGVGVSGVGGVGGNGEIRVGKRLEDRYRC